MNLAIPVTCACLAAIGVSGCRTHPAPAAQKSTPARASARPSPYQNASLSPQRAATASEREVMLDPGSPSAGEVTRAVAVVEPTKGHEVHGVVTFEKVAKGVRVEAKFSGLPPGRHGFHIHVFGDCSGADGNSAGTHFNLMGSSLHPPKDIDRITGNLGELDAAKDGKATFDAVIQHASLEGLYSIVGRSVVIHEKGNDPKSPPMGAAGGRLACGVIGIRSS